MKDDLNGICEEMKCCRTLLPDCLRSDSPQTLVDEICRDAMELLDCQCLFNYLQEPDSGELHLSAFAGISEEDAQEIAELEYGVAVCGSVAQRRKRIVCENIQQRDDEMTQIVKSYGVKAYCCLPLLVEDSLIGTLSFGSRNRSSFEPEEIEVMASVSGRPSSPSRSHVSTTEQRLRDSESRFRMFAALAPLGIVVSDFDDKTLYVNPRFTKLFGYTSEDMPSIKEWWKLAYPDPSVRKLVRRQWQSAVEEARKSGNEIQPLEHSVRCKDGSFKYVEFRMSTSENLNIVVFTDITERKEAQKEKDKLTEQLVHMQKMESIGRLAGGVAHDYNNMLAVIIGYCELAMAKERQDKSLRGDLRQILSAANRSKEITRQLLAFARRQTIEPRPIDLNEAVESLLKMLQRLIGEDIELIRQPGAGKMTVLMGISPG
ncbi:MAG: GAF domain-containing protein [Planctomycetota bacterium]|nr:GAF domain-containing protein [Planctomycetota bacterium]